MDNNIYIGLDVGEARTGFARASDVAKIAEPLFTVPTKDALAKIVELAGKEKIAGLVVGLPRNLDGDDTAQTKWVRQWVDEIKPKINFPIYVQDEALTSKLAETKKAADGSKYDTDSLAASIIMQDFIDSPEAERHIW